MKSRIEYCRDFNHIRQVAPRVRVAQINIGMLSRYSALNLGNDLQKKMTEKLKDAIRENIICVDKQMSFWGVLHHALLC